jgi:hypothetical protein
MISSDLDDKSRTLRICGKKEHKLIDKLNNVSGLTLGKVYRAFGKYFEEGKIVEYLIYDNNNQVKHFSSHRFRPVEEVRLEKLNKLGI